MADPRRIEQVLHNLVVNAIKYSADSTTVQVRVERRSDDVLGPYPPAGPDWQRSIRKDVTQMLTGVEMQSPDPLGLAEHWGEIIGVAVTKDADGNPALKLPNATFGFAKGPVDLMTGLTFRVADVAKVRDAAKARGCKVEGDAFDLCGVTFRLTA